MYKKIAHRANIDGLLENSLSAVHSCLSQNVQGIEIDIRHTLDKKPIVFHDNDFLRLTNSSRIASKEGPFVSQLTFKEIQKDFKLKNDEKIPALEDVLDLIKNKDTMLFLELKDRIEVETLDLIKLYFKNSTERLRIISFDHALLKSLKKHDSFFAKTKMMALHEVPRTTWIPGAVKGIEGVNANIYNPVYAMYLKALGLEVGIWWLPDKMPPVVAKSLFGFIDFFTTDNYKKY